MSSKKTIQFFYDVVSPYSYFAFEVLCRYRGIWNLELKFRPVFLGGIMRGSDNKPPGANPSKGAYLFKDVARLSKYFSVPIKFPSNPTELMFMNGTMTAQRFLSAVDMVRPDLVEGISRELWSRAWGRDEDIIEPPGIAEAAIAAGLPKDVTESLLSKVKSDEVKERLKATTQEAIDLGAFGAPMIVFDANNQQEWIFGSDRFPVLAQMLGEKWEGPNPGVSSKL